MCQSVVVIPCYNESRRLRAASFQELAGRGDLALLFVDDGSTDDTRQRLDALCGDSSGRLRCRSLARNCGKAEAVRLGLLQALDAGAEFVGFADADLATPASEIARLMTLVRQGSARVVLGCRVARLGAQIDRSFWRHLLGRCFATGASVALGLPVYDTQCGAKFFCDTPALRDALSQPFLSRWAFDVELLGRLLSPLTPGVEAENPGAILEEPLSVWTDHVGSKLDLAAKCRTGAELLAIAAALRRRRLRCAC